VVIALTLTGCASTGVVPTGNNEYMISKLDMGDVWHEGSKVLAKFYIEANEYCAKDNLPVERISESAQDVRVFVKNASTTLRFRCVTAKR